MQVQPSRWFCLRFPHKVVVRMSAWAAASSKGPTEAGEATSKVVTSHSYMQEASVPHLMASPRGCLSALKAWQLLPHMCDLSVQGGSCNAF